MIYFLYENNHKNIFLSNIFLSKFTLIHNVEVKPGELKKNLVEVKFTNNGKKTS